LMNSNEIRLFWLLLSIEKWSGVPFTHIYEWKRCSHSLGSSGSSSWNFMVEMVTLGYVSMICFPLSGFESNSESTSSSKDFISANNDCLESHSSVLCQRIFWSSQFSSVLRHYITLICLWLGLVVLGLAILALFFDLGD
jgi:hypothetical protein